MFTLLMSTVRAGCKKYMWPVNATVNGAGNPRSPVNLTCEPVSTVNTPTMSCSNVTWYSFASTNQMEEYIKSCSSSSCCGRNSAIITESDSNFQMEDCSLMILRPEMSQSWYVPSFEVENCVFAAPGSACTFGSNSS